MAKIRISRIVPVSMEQAFSLLTDVEAFPAFVTGVQSLRRDNVTVADGVETFDARAFIRTRKLSGTMVAVVQVNRQERSIRVSPKIGPWTVLNARCRLRETPQGVEAACELELDVAIPGLRGLLDEKLGAVTAGYADLFVARARSRAALAA